MPTYVYRCQNGHDFEEFQSMADAPIDICPVCGARAERQISGGSGLIFKGSGFYITDYAKKSGGSVKAESTISKTSDSAKPDIAASTSKSEAKSEKKGENK